MIRVTLSILTCLLLLGCASNPASSAVVGTWAVDDGRSQPPVVTLEASGTAVFEPGSAVDCGPEATTTVRYRLDGDVVSFDRMIGNNHVKFRYVSQTDRLLFNYDKTSSWADGFRRVE